MATCKDERKDAPWVLKPGDEFKVTSFEDWMYFDDCIDPFDIFNRPDGSQPPPKPRVVPGWMQCKCLTFDKTDGGCITEQASCDDPESLFTLDIKHKNEGEDTEDCCDNSYEFDYHIKFPCDLANFNSGIASWYTKYRDCDKEAISRALSIGVDDYSCDHLYNTYVNPYGLGEHITFDTSHLSIEWPKKNNLDFRLTEVLGGQVPALDIDPEGYMLQQLYRKQDDIEYILRDLTYFNDVDGVDIDKEDMPYYRMLCIKSTEDVKAIFFDGDTAKDFLLQSCIRILKVANGIDSDNDVYSNITISGIYFYTDTSEPGSVDYIGIKIKRDTDIKDYEDGATYNLSVGNWGAIRGYSSIYESPNTKVTIDVYAGYKVKISDTVQGSSFEKLHTLSGRNVSYSILYSEIAAELTPSVYDDPLFWMSVKVNEELADIEDLAYTNCGGDDCAYTFFLDKRKLECKIGMRIQGDTVKSNMCGGGGMTTELYLSCPWDRHIPVDRPTYPCDCIFVISYLLTLPLGAVLL